jgi:hypothetical protein
MEMRGRSKKNVNEYIGTEKTRDAKIEIKQLRNNITNFVELSTTRETTTCAASR